MTRNDIYGFWEELILRTESSKTTCHACHQTIMSGEEHQLIKQSWYQSGTPHKNKLRFHLRCYELRKATP